MMMLTLRNARFVSTFSVVALSLVACSGKKDSAGSPSDTAAAATTSMTPPADAMAGMKGDSSMQGMGNMQGMAMTGDPDQDFLRMMSDHHKGLTAMAHGAKDMALPVAADAKKLDAKQDAELDKMGAMLQQYYKDAYTPRIMPSNQAMIDALKGKTGNDYQKTFYQNVVQHHQEALKMIDDYLPKSKKPALKTMAEKMKADQTREIAEFQQKIAKL